MVLHYKQKSEKRKVETINAISKNYGLMAKKVKMRLDELTAAKNLNDMRYLPQAACHELKGNRAGQFAVSISGNHRIIFEPYNTPKEGILDWSTVTEIEIIKIGEDYH